MATHKWRPHFPPFFDPLAQSVTFCHTYQYPLEKDVLNPLTPQLSFSSFVKKRLKWSNMVKKFIFDLSLWIHNFIEFDRSESNDRKLVWLLLSTMSLVRWSFKWYVTLFVINMPPPVWHFLLNKITVVMIFSFESAIKVQKID